MKCDLCQGTYQEKSVILSFERDGRSVVVENVPAMVCDRCGDELISAATFRKVEELLESKPDATAPLYRFPETASSRP